MSSALPPSVHSVSRDTSLFSECYRELRRLAIYRLRNTPPGQTLNVTALVNETYLKLTKNALKSNAPVLSRSHFLFLAADAMRQIIVDYYRYRRSLKQGGGHTRQDLDVSLLPDEMRPERVLELNDAIDRLVELQPQKGELVKLRYFVGLTMAECAEVLQISVPTAERQWRYARAWLAREMQESS